MAKYEVTVLPSAQKEITKFRSTDFAPIQPGAIVTFGSYQKQFTYFNRGIVLYSGARLDTGVRVGKYVRVGSGAKVGEGSNLGDYSTVEQAAELGPEVTLEPGATVHIQARVGRAAIILEGQAVECETIVPAGAIIPPLITTSPS